MTDQELGWAVLIVSCVAWLIKWVVEFMERKKINTREWRDARVRMGLPQDYRHNRWIA